MRIFALSFLLLCGCASLNNNQISEPVIKNDNAITKLPFTVEFADKSKFTNNSHLVVSIYDGGLMDTSMQPIGKFETHISGEPVKITGNINYLQSDLKKLSMPSFSARLELNGKLIGINMSAQHYTPNQTAQTIIIDKVQ